MRTTTNENARSRVPIDSLSESEVIEFYLELGTCLGGLLAASQRRIPDRMVWEIVGALSRVFDLQWRRAEAAKYTDSEPRPAIESFLKMLCSLEARLREDLDGND